MRAISSNGPVPTEVRDAEALTHHAPQGFADRFALGFTWLLRLCADIFFAKRYGHRAIVLETVAAVPGMVGATITHLQCLRRMVDDGGWIHTLLEEAENERMHLMTFIEIAKPTVFERLVVRDDEAHHRDVNHRFASKLAGESVDHLHTAPYPQHAGKNRPQS